MQCQMAFSSKQDLTLHQNMTHNDKIIQIEHNVNQSDSDSSDGSDLIEQMIEQRPITKAKIEQRPITKVKNESAA